MGPMTVWLFHCVCLFLVERSYVNYKEHFQIVVINVVGKSLADVLTQRRSFRLRKMTPYSRKNDLSGGSRRRVTGDPGAPIRPELNLRLFLKINQ